MALAQLGSHEDYRELTPQEIYERVKKVSNHVYSTK
jgi:hypothetical protein